MKRSSFLLVASALALTACSAADSMAPNQKSVPAVARDEQVSTDVIDAASGAASSPVCTKGTPASQAVAQHAPEVFVRLCAEKPASE